MTGTYYYAPKTKRPTLGLSLFRMKWLNPLASVWYMRCVTDACIMVIGLQFDETTAIHNSETTLRFRGWASAISARLGSILVS